MTPQRALELLEANEERKSASAFVLYKNTVKEALEKQIAKKPNYEGNGYYNGELVYDTWICPCCEKQYEVDYDDYDYCPNCGQKIDWSDLNA